MFLNNNSLRTSLSYFSKGVQTKFEDFSISHETSGCEVGSSTQLLRFHLILQRKCTSLLTRAIISRYIFDTYEYSKP